MYHLFVLQILQAEISILETFLFTIVEICSVKHVQVEPLWDQLRYSEFTVVRVRARGSSIAFHCIKHLINNGIVSRYHEPKIVMNIHE